MRLQNLQIQFSRAARDPHVITYVDENDIRCKATVYSCSKFAQYVIDCLESPPRLREERDVLISIRNDLETLIKGSDHWKGNNFDSVTHLIEIANERNALRESHSMIAAALQIDSTKPSDILKAIADVKALLAHPDATQPQLSEIRYVLHGDIQPCSVLYSDDTTTLLRLDEGDMMLETDTIEWSDSVTYRCQELLKGESKRSGHRVSLPTVKAVAQLVRDERILLNDNGGDELGDAKGEPSCNNAYKHTDVHLAEESYRNMGYSTEQLVTAGLGHYVPALAQADTTEWASNNSPTPLR